MKPRSSLITMLLLFATLVSLLVQSIGLTPPETEPAVNLPTPVVGSAAPLHQPVPQTLPSPPPNLTPFKPLAKTTKPTSKPVADNDSSHPNYVYTALVSNTNPVYGLEPFNNRISAPQGLAAVTSQSSEAPVIAVIDTGFALSHVDLQNRWALNTGEIGPTTTGSTQACTSVGQSLDKSCNNLDNDGNGYPSDWRGWDFVNNDNSPMAGTTNPFGQAAMHGTITASLAAAYNPNAKIMPLQALDDNGSGTTDTVAAAIRYAADNGANIISLSLGSSSDDTYLRSQIDYAISKGVLVVAAAGNSGCNCLSYPAAYPEVLAVGASTSTDSLASFSSYGSNLDVLAPGTAGDVCGALWTAASPTSLYTCNYSGTSFSTPIVASLASLLLTQDPLATPSDLIRFITQSADHLPAMGSAIRTIQDGYGRIDVQKAVLAASLASPNGELINKTTVSLGSTDLTLGPTLNSVCLGQPGSSCTITATNLSNGTVIQIGTQTLDSAGGANFVWNAATLDLTPGSWRIAANLNGLGQTSAQPPVNLTISP